MKLILHYVKKYWLGAIISPLMVLLAVASDLAQPTLMAQIIDKGVMNDDLIFVVMAGLKMISISLLGIVAGFIMSWFASQVSINAGADLREDLFRKIQTLSYANLDQLDSSSLITRLTSDVKQIERIIHLSLRILLRAPLKIVGSLIMAIIIGRELSLVIVIFSPLIMITIIILVRRAQPYFQAVQKQLDRVNSRLQENLSGIRLVKAFLREDREKEKFNQANGQLVEKSIQANRLMVIMQPLMHLFMNSAVVAVLWLGKDLVLQGDFPLGKLLAFINYLSQMLFMLIMLSNVIIQLSRSLVSLDRIKEVFAQKPQIKDQPDAQEAPPLNQALTYENVSFRYGDEEGEPVLQNISFTIPPGETLAILGATGSGKSSLINLIPRFYDPQSGRITIGGVDIKEMTQSTLRAQIAVVPQTPLLFSGSVKKNILFGQETEEEIMIGAAQMARIDDFIETLPKGYQTDVNQRGVNLSGGQKQRISLARALVRKPPILILDDSTSAVDLKTEEAIQKALESREPRSTCLIVAQRISSVRHAHNIIVLEEGRIAVQGTHKELWKTSPLYRDICLSQLDEKEVIA